MGKGQMIIVKLYDHNGEFKAYDIARDSHSIISFGCKSQDGTHQEFDQHPVKSAEGWAKRFGFRVVIETRSIEFIV